MENEEVNQQEQEQQVQDTHNIEVKPTVSGGNIATVSHPDPTAPEAQPQEQPQGEPEAKPQEQPTENIQDEVYRQMQTEEDLKKDLSSRGVDWDALSKEMDTNGELSQESLAALDKAGYPKSVVDAYLNGVQALADKFVSQVKTFAGGEEEFARMQQFLATCPASEVNAFNSLIERGDLGQIQLAIQGIKAQMTQKFGTANPTVMTNGGVAGTPSGYTSTREMVKDMNDPRYQVDPAFTREVYNKIKNSTLF
jgi:hypothetical protein